MHVDVDTHISHVYRAIDVNMRVDIQDKAPATVALNGTQNGPV